MFANLVAQFICVAMSYHDSGDCMGGSSALRLHFGCSEHCCYVVRVSSVRTHMCPVNWMVDVPLCVFSSGAANIQHCCCVVRVFSVWTSTWDLNGCEHALARCKLFCIRCAGAHTCAQALPLRQPWHLDHTDRQFTAMVGRCALQG